MSDVVRHRGWRWASYRRPLPGCVSGAAVGPGCRAVPPPQIIEGVLHQGCKMILGGTSKSNKSWGLLDLALSVASGTELVGRRCAKMPVALPQFRVARLGHRATAGGHLSVRGRSATGCGDALHLWNLRGHNADLTLLRPKLEEQLARLPVRADHPGPDLQSAGGPGRERQRRDCRADE